MEYTDVERQVLSLMERTDFKNLSKSDVISYASKLSELRPEVATQVIAQFPELAKLIQSSMVEYKDILEKIVVSDDESTNQVFLQSAHLWQRCQRCIFHAVRGV